MLNNKRLVAEIINGEEVIMTIDSNMLHCEFGSLDRGNLTDTVNWGIYSNRGSVSFIDKTGFFNNENVNSSEIKKYTVIFYLAKDSKIRIANFNIFSAKYEDSTRTVDLELISPIISLSKEKTKNPIYPFYSRYLIELLKDINDNSPYAINVGEDSENLYKTVISCPYIEVDTVWNVMTKICQASMSRVVETQTGDIEITSSFPNRTPIIVNPNNIINISEADFVRIENANIDVTKREVFEGKVLEGSSKTFSISRDEQSRFVGVEGFLPSKVSNEGLGSAISPYLEYIEGVVYAETPYKIFKSNLDTSIVNHRVQQLNLSGGGTNIVADIQYSSNSTLCSDVEIINGKDIAARVRKFRIARQVLEAEEYSQDDIVQGGTFKFPVYTFLDNGTETISTTNGVEGEKIPSNDLIQTFSYKEGESISTPLGQYILDEVKKRYSNGIECFEIECLFNSYYDETGDLVFDGNDMGNHFNKYDLIIPYVMKKGEKVPLRKNADGTPQKFRIIGISYSYDGLLKQKLSVQEDRYDVD